jgi:hypothetical protein
LKTPGIVPGDEKGFPNVSKSLSLPPGFRPVRVIDFNGTDLLFMRICGII